MQSTSCLAFSASTCTTGSITSTTGNLFVTSSVLFDGTFSSVQDSKSNSYTAAVTGITAASVAEGRQDYKAAGAGGASHTFTLNFTGTFAAFAASEISGATSTPLDKSSGHGNSATTAHTSNATAATTQANELLYGSTAHCETTTQSADAPYTERVNVGGSGGNCGMLVGTNVVSATGTYAFTSTTPANQDTVSIITTWLASATGKRQRCIGCGTDKKVISGQ